MKQFLLELIESGDDFTNLCAFYSEKNKRGFGLFSCLAGESFPKKWVEEISAGEWDEKGVYGDNFRKAFKL